MRAIQGELWLKLIFARIPFLLQYEGAAAEDGRSPGIWDTYAHSGLSHRLYPLTFFPWNELSVDFLHFLISDHHVLPNVMLDLSGYC